jgi:hypothetical protein
MMGGKMLFIIVLIIAIAGFVWAERERRSAARELVQTSAQLEELKKSTENSSQETANRVRENVSKLMNIPTDPAPTVATISDIEKLKTSNAFFNPAENGDYLILTGNRAILYDLERNIILDVAPFQVTPSTASPSPTTRPRTPATPTAEPDAE